MFFLILESALICSIPNRRAFYLLVKNKRGPKAMVHIEFEGPSLHQETIGGRCWGGCGGLHVLLMCLNRESLMVGIRDTHVVSSQIRGDVQSRSFARSTAHSIHRCAGQVSVKRSAFGVL